MISIIAAIDQKRGLGKNNQMAWKIPGELARFKEITTPHPIIMGRKTFQSIGRILPNRYNIVITRDKDFTINGLRNSENFVISNSLEEALEKAKSASNSEEIFIIGGGQIFKEALEKKMVDKLYLTLVEGDYEADTFFPDYSNYKVISEENREAGIYKYKFINLEKKI
ncbi:MAG: hypothetical protein A2798_03420 [Candidatus Levybacteria bacterium RIFCSPHIGHO2_01_FULL_37_17]|nr:MAG: hypothetical protein A2798_03420 [Candidatus Levybacteria bacterium RIFCSPHIGHO2_01_FULL_37_17]OGH36903.1 MAG: hypothetical protein A2959_01410 [Candidatus Levybacteria bacterium RIFCSPLOWO2_01_FULL_38_23]